MTVDSSQGYFPWKIVGQYITGYIQYIFFTEKTPSITKEKHFKVLLIGDPNVGKTSFAQRYANDTFRGDYKGTVGVDFALKVLRVSGDTLVKLQLWDVAGEGSANFLNL